MKPTVRKWLLAALAAVLLGAATRFVPAINQRRVADGLVSAPLPQAAQPSMLLGPLLAIGRAPLVDFLWMRASKLKEEGRYFDALQLAQTIGNLQPRFAAVWGFNAWNMAYNISVTFKSPEERWRWVRNGIELLRDQGIERNPRSVLMYKELAWIFFHKVGQFMDDHHMYYKLQLALLMEDILGTGPEPDWEGLAAAPADWSTLASDPDVQALAAAFQKEIGADISRPGVFLGRLADQNPSRELKALLADPKTADARRRVELFWRAKRLREETKIDPARVVALRKAYGPLDMRTADANALYWASLGTEISLGNRLALDIDKLNTDRIEVYCLQSLFRAGRLVMSPFARDGDPPMILPDVRFADAMRRAFIAVSREYPAQPGQGPVHENFKSAFINFMRESVLRFNEAGQLDKSREYFDYLVEHYPDPIYEKGYDEFVKWQWRQVTEIVQQRDVQSRLMATLSLGVQLIAYGSEEQGAAYIAFAQRLWKQFEKEQVSDRYRLKPFPVMYEYVVHEMGKRMPEAIYERVLKRTGFKRPASTQPAADPMSLN